MINKPFPEYGCCCDLCGGSRPDNCVINTGDNDDCIYSEQRNGRVGFTNPEQCPYWRKVSDWKKDHKETK